MSVQKNEKQMIHVSYNSKERKRVSVKFFIVNDKTWWLDSTNPIEGAPSGASRVYLAVDTYEEDAEGVWQTLHCQLTVLEVVIAHVKNFIDVNVREGEHNDDEADDDIHARQVKHSCTQSDTKADSLSEPEYEV